MTLDESHESAPLWSGWWVRGWYFGGACLCQVGEQEWLLPLILAGLPQSWWKICEANRQFCAWEDPGAGTYWLMKPGAVGAKWRGMSSPRQFLCCSGSTLAVELKGVNAVMMDACYSSHHHLLPHHISLLMSLKTPFFLSECRCELIPSREERHWESFKGSHIWKGGCFFPLSGNAL